MIQKILFALSLCCILISCGKKGDPKYENLESKSILQTFSNKKA